VRRRTGRTLVLALVAAVGVVGCGGGATAPTDPGVTDSPTASARVLGEAELAVCDGTIRMGQGVTRLRQVRIRRGAADRLGSALDMVLEGQQLVLDYQPGRMRSRVRTLGFAVTNMTIALEDFRTTDRYDAAASNVKRRITALRRAIDSFRSWVGCPDPDPGGQAAAATSGA
jgi:hypothetical protein